MENGLINEGLALMLAGMGTVFVFLTALVIIMTLMSRLALALTQAVETDADAEEIAAIAAAIQKHRNP